MCPFVGAVDDDWHGHPVVGPDNDTGSTRVCRFAFCARRGYFSTQPRSLRSSRTSLGASVRSDLYSAAEANRSCVRGSVYLATSPLMSLYFLTHSTL